MPKQKIKLPLNHLIPIVVMALLGVSFSVAIYYVVKEYEVRRLYTGFIADVKDRMAILEKEIDVNIGVVDSVAAFYGASEEVQRDEFYRFIKPLLFSHPYIQAIEWVPRVAEEQRSSFEEKARKAIDPSFRIYDIDQAGQLFPSPKRGEYFPVFYIEPFAENQLALGLDIGANPLEKDIIGQSATTGSVATLPNVGLVQENKISRAIRIIKPVYENSRDGQIKAADSTELKGFVLNLFRLREFVEKSLSYLSAKDIDLYIFDDAGESGYKFLYAYRSGKSFENQPQISYEKLKKHIWLSAGENLRVADKRWHILFAATDKYIAMRKLNYEWLFLLMGFLVTTLTTSYIVTNLRYAIDMERQVRLRTLELQQKTDLLQEANREMDHFVHTVSHDLQAPLRGISAFASFLMEEYKGKLDDKANDYVIEIDRGAKRLTRLIDDLLTLSRFSRLRNPYEMVPITEIVHSVRDRLKFDIQDKKVVFKIRGELPVISCDRIKIEEVFVNLIGNAIKFFSKDNPNPAVEVGYSLEKEGHRFYVKDNGIGIEEEYHLKIFDIFKKLHHENDYSGTGVGLAIVKKIIDDHGGRIWVDSKPSEGAVFYFVIPQHLKNQALVNELKHA